MKTKRGVARAFLGAALVLVALVGCEGNVNDDTVAVFPIELVSRSMSGGASGNSSQSPHASADGQVVVFSSYATDLDPLDSSTMEDVFARDTVSGFTMLVSVNSTWTGSGNGESRRPCVSPDGRFVTFLSRATDLIPAGAGFAYLNSIWDYDVFVHDLWTGTTLPVSVNAAETGTGDRGVDESSAPSVVTDSNYVYVVFSSSAMNMMTATNGYNQIFLRRIPLASFVVPVVTMLDIQSGDTIMVSGDAYTEIPTNNPYGDGYSYHPVIAIDEAAGFMYVAWDSSASDLIGDPLTTDTNGQQDVFWRPVGIVSGTPGTTLLISYRDPSFAPPQGGDGASQNPSISADGNFVTFQSLAKNLLPAGDDNNNESDIFLRRYVISGGTTDTVRISEGALGEANEESGMPYISGDGRYVVFTSRASNLIEGDSNGAPDVFIKDTLQDTLSRVSITVFGSETYGGSGSTSDWEGWGGVPTADGGYVIFMSDALNILPGTTFFEGGQIYRRKF